MMSERFGRALWMGLAVAAIWLGGCAPSRVTALREESHRAYSFEVPTDYKTVYERILLRARQRYVIAENATFQPGVSAKLSPESQSSAITLWDSGGIGIRYRLSAQIRAIDPEHTQVDLYAAAKRDRAEARLWAGWADTPLEK